MEAEDRPCAAGLMIAHRSPPFFLRWTLRWRQLHSGIVSANLPRSLPQVWNCTQLHLPSPALSVGLKRELKMFPHHPRMCILPWCFHYFTTLKLVDLSLSQFAICKCAHLTNSLFCSVFFLTISDEQRHTVRICLTWPQSSSPTPMKIHQSHWSMVRAVQENGFPPNCTMIICNKVYSISPDILQ